MAEGERIGDHRVRIALLIRALSRGGAERQMVTLAQELSRKDHEVHVLSFYDGGEFLSDLSRSGVETYSARKRGRWDMAGFLVRLVRTLREVEPDVLYSSMPAANIVGGLASRLAGRFPVVWRVASSDMDLSRYDKLSAFSYRVEAYCSFLPTAVVSNSFSGRDSAIQRGFGPGKIKVVWNGVKVDEFFPDIEAGLALKEQWCLDRGKWTIGQVARGDPKKGYETFLDAAGLLCELRTDVQFLCVGVGNGDYARRLRERAVRNGIAPRVTWRSAERDMRRVYNAMDIHTLSSRFGEGCSNSVAEAMSCGVPCVVTDVGDSARVVGETGEVLRAESPEQLMAGWLRMLVRLETDAKHTKTLARDRAVDSFSVERYVDETEKILLGVN